jgi:hypothetical protein
MKVTHIRVVSAHWERDFGRVEARVHVVLRDSDTSPEFAESLLVSVPARDPESGLTLRARLHNEAAMMAILLRQSELRIGRLMAA